MSAEKSAVKSSTAVTQIKMIPIAHLRANPYNRISFGEVDIDQLSKSISTQGVQEPLVVRPTEESEVFEIASGHRRWKSAERAGLLEVPCFIRNLTHQQVSEMNIVSNIQREDTPALELAKMVSDYLFRFPQSQAEAARHFGKSATWLADLLGLLQMPPEVVEGMSGVQLSLKIWKLFNRLSLESKLEVATQISSGGFLADDLEQNIRKKLKNTRVRGDRRKSVRRANDPLASQWENLLASDKVAPPGSWHVRYAGSNRWELTYPVDVTQPARSLAAFLRKLSDALDGTLI